MVKNREFFTSESVTEGHPDKMADQISDSILDAILAKDKNARVACETLVTTGMVHVSVKFRRRATSTFRTSFVKRFVPSVIPVRNTALTAILAASWYPSMNSRRILLWASTMPLKEGRQFGPVRHHRCR